MDVYYPPDSTSGARRPAVLFVTGFPDAGAERMVGCKLKEMGSYTSWAELTTTSGLVAINLHERRAGSGCSRSTQLRSAERRGTRHRREQDWTVGMLRQRSNRVVPADAGRT